MAKKRVKRYRCWFLEINPKSLDWLVVKKKIDAYDKTDPEKLGQQLQACWENSAEGRTAAVAVCESADGLFHAHMALYNDNAISRSVVSNFFGQAHADPQYGTKEQVQAYLEKTGKFKEKGEKVFCTIGIEKLQDARKTSKNPSGIATVGGKHYEELLELVKIGMTDREIIEENPVYMRELNTIATLRDMFRPVTNYREVKVTYIFGPTGTGKTRFVRNNPKIPIDQIYSANGNHPFDGYTGQDVLLFDEFRADYPLKDMLRYLDNYCTTLSARYHDKISAYTRVFIISNWELEKQYEYERTTDKETYKAFLRRISEVLWIMGDYIIELRPDIEKWYKDCKGNIDAYNWYKDIDWPRGIIRYTSVNQYLSRNKISGIINRGQPLVDSPLPEFNF